MLAWVLVMALVGDLDTEAFVRVGGHAIGAYSGSTVSQATYAGGVSAGAGLGVRYQNRGQLVLGGDIDGNQTFGRLSATMFNMALLVGHYWGPLRFEAGPLLTFAWVDYYDRTRGFDASQDVWSTSSVGLRTQLLYRFADRYSVGLAVDAGLAAMPHAEGSVRFGVRL